MNRDLSVIINSPTSGIVTTWSPSIDWNPENLDISTLTCSYSYDNFVTTSNVANCTLGGSDILAPAADGNRTLSVKVTGNAGLVANSSINFNAGGWVLQT